MKSFRWSLFFFVVFFIVFFLSSSFRNLRVMKKKILGDGVPPKRLIAPGRPTLFSVCPDFHSLISSQKRKVEEGPFLQPFFDVEWGTWWQPRSNLHFICIYIWRKFRFFLCPNEKKERPKKKTKQEKKQHKKESEKRGRCSTKTPVYEVISSM